MHRRVAIDFAGRRLQDFDLQALGKPKHIDGADHARLGGLHRILLVVDRRAGQAKIEDLIDLDEQRMRDVVAQQLEALVIEEMLDIAPSAGEEVVARRALGSRARATVAQMRPEEASSAGNENASLKMHRATLWSRRNTRVAVMEASYA